MATIGKKKKTKRQPAQPTTRRSKKTPIPKSGYKRVAKALQDENYYDISNDEQLQKYFNKDGSIKKSALRSEKSRQEFVKELAKAKEEIKQLQKEKAELEKENKRLREKQKKDRAKKRKQKETYKQNKHGYSQEQYDEFLDILSDVYDEVALMFYDSDQVMQMIDDENFSYEDIVNLLIEINKEKENELPDVEKKLAKKRKKHLTREEQQETTDEVAQMIYLASKSNMSPDEWYRLKYNDPITYQDRLLTIIPKNERYKYL